MNDYDRFYARSMKRNGFPKQVCEKAICQNSVDIWKLHGKQSQDFELADGKCGIPASKKGRNGDVRDIHGMHK